MSDDHSNVGYLTWDQFERFRWAMTDSMKLVPWLRVAGYIRGGDADELKHRSTDHPLGLPPTWLAAEEITRLMHELNPYPDLEDAANDEYGAWVATELTREVQAAAHKWPFEDRPHNVRHLRCGACDMLALRYEPPKAGGGTVLVKCRECGLHMDEQRFIALVALVEAEENERRLGDRKRGPRESREIAAHDLPVDIQRTGADNAPSASAVA